LPEHTTCSERGYTVCGLLNVKEVFLRLRPHTKVLCCVRPTARNTGW
jgi:hypothetical protein